MVMVMVMAMVMVMVMVMERERVGRNEASAKGPGRSLRCEHDAAPQAGRHEPLT
jgi:hypothetical protein